MTKFVSGWLKMRVGRGESGFEALGGLSAEAATCAALMRFGLDELASATTGRPEVRPAFDGLWTGAAVLASELVLPGIGWLDTARLRESR